MKASELRNLSDDDLMTKYAELSMELSRVKAAAARGAAKKEIGKIRPLRKNISRVLTVIREKEVEEENE